MVVPIFRKPLPRWPFCPTPSAPPAEAACLEFTALHNLQEWISTSLEQPLGTPQIGIRE